jgi:hypothetical protein
MTTNRFLGRGAGIGNIEELTPTEVKTMLGISNPNTGVDGYLDLGNIRIMWGKNTGSAGARTETLPASFKTSTSYTVATTVATSNTDFGRVAHVLYRNASNFAAYVTATDNSDSSADFYYIAIGQKP